MIQDHDHFHSTLISNGIGGKIYVTSLFDYSIGIVRSMLVAPNTIGLAHVLNVIHWELGCIKCCRPVSGVRVISIYTTVKISIGFAIIK